MLRLATSMPAAFCRQWSLEGEAGTAETCSRLGMDGKESWISKAHMFDTGIRKVSRAGPSVQRKIYEFSLSEVLMWHARYLLLGGLQNFILYSSCQSTHMTRV